MVKCWSICSQIIQYVFIVYTKSKKEDTVILSISLPYGNQFQNSVVKISSDLQRSCHACKYILLHYIVKY